MRKIIQSMQVSLDGFMEGPGREIDWHLVDDELHRHFNEKFKPMSAFLHGRVTYELMADYWPTADEDPTSPVHVVEFARIWREMPKFVFSRTLASANWNTTILRDVVVDEIKALKAQPGGDMVLSSADLAAPFRRHGLLDEYHVYIHPVLIGQGKPMFQDAKADLELLETRTFGNGVVLLRYRLTEGSE